MAGYIPDTETEKIVWLENFTHWVALNGATHGVTTQEIAELDTKKIAASTALIESAAAQDAARGATANKNNRIGEALVLARDLAQRIQHHPNTTDQDRGNAGLTIPDAGPSKSSDDEILTITPPDIYLDFGIRQQITIHWGPNPQDEKHNGRPHGVLGCEIQYHKGGIPDNEDDWRPLDTDTDSPYVHIVHESVPTTYAYRARYFGKKLKHGSHGDSAVCTVSV